VSSSFKERELPEGDKERSKGRYGEKKFGDKRKAINGAACNDYRMGGGTSKKMERLGGLAPGTCCGRLMKLETPKDLFGGKREA